MHSATDISSSPSVTVQQAPVTHFGSQSPLSSDLDASRTPPLSFTPSLSASCLHTPVSPNALSQSPRVNTPLVNQLSPTVSSPQNHLSSPRDLALSHSPLSRIQNQLSLSAYTQSPRAPPFAQDIVSSISLSTSLPTLDSSSSLSTSSPALSTPSNLSPSPSQYQLKPRLLDAPIDIHTLSLTNTGDDMDDRSRHANGGMSGSDVLSLTAALSNEGPTPTQESFKPLGLPVCPHPSPHASTTVPTGSFNLSSFAPPNPSTHIIDLDDSPVPPSELSPPLPSNAASPSLMSGAIHPSLSQYASHVVGDGTNFSAQQPLPSSTSQPSSLASADELKTPNVYINGLPPNFPEEQLLAMTREFGEVISVRTFTRHVSDRPSGYGFVLFGSVDAAEKCIETLRKYRNLHPSFSKRVHKIPGTTYASSHADQSVPNTDSIPDDNESDTFKSRMERLHDTSSTNLYMEGLPMDINEPTLAALVSPYKIMSSRFFQTRLSVPPRVIAFVRLESRLAAEEIIERLHGRMVRGWADAGCRISVRFADTSEQRELRRAERMNRDGDQSPSRLTVAQAALLNLKGGQLRRSPVGGTLNLGQPGLSPPFTVSSLPSVSDASPNFAPAVVLRGSAGFVSPNGGLMPPLTYEPLGTNNGVLDHAESHPSFISRKAAASPLPLAHQPIQQFAQTQHLPVIGHGAVGAAYMSQDQIENGGLGATSLRVPAIGTFDGALPLRDLNAVGIMDGSTARAQSGYTPLEKDILQKYLHGQQLQQQILRQERTVFSRATASSAAALGTRNSAGLLGRRLVDTLPSLSEEDFHAQGGRDVLTSLQSTASMGGRTAPSAMPLSLPPSRLAMDDVNAKINFTRQRNQTHSSGSRLSLAGIGGHAESNGKGGSEERTRSSTVPEEYLSKRGLGVSETFTNLATSVSHEAIKNSTKYDSQASNSSIDGKFDSKALLRSGTQHSGISSMHGKEGASSNGQRIPAICETSSYGAVNTNTNTCNIIPHNVQKHTSTRIDTSSAILHPVSVVPGPTDIAATGAGDGFHARGSSGSDGNASPLDSPALTYSNSARTPASLSPSTPFSAFAEGPPFDGGMVVAAAGAKSGEENVKGSREVGLGVNLAVANQSRKTTAEHDATVGGGEVIAPSKG